MVPFYRNEEIESGLSFVAAETMPKTLSGEDCGSNKNITSKAE
jgi:hypothetical protein